MAAKLVKATTDPTTANTRAVQYIDNETKWHNTTTDGMFMCVDATAGTWVKISVDTVPVESPVESLEEGDGDASY